MRQKNVRLLTGGLLAILGLASCVPPTNTNTSSNTNTANTNTANTNSTAGSEAGLDTREPDVYRSKISFSAETIGEKQATLPQLNIEYARNQADRRFAFTVPGAGPIIYLDVKDKRYVIMPDRKQYAELTPQATGGMQMPSSLTPGEIVNRLKSVKGYERIGDETLNGRSVTKYRFTGSKATNTSAGTVSAESFVYVDKETGLPLRSETVSEATNDVKGVKGIKLVTEMSEIQTQVDPAAFELPAGLTKVSAEEIKEKVETTVRLALALLAQLQQSQTAAGSPSPAASPNPSPVK